MTVELRITCDCCGKVEIIPYEILGLETCNDVKCKAGEMAGK